MRSSWTCVLGNASLRAKMRLDWDDRNHAVAQAEARPFLERGYRAPWELKL